MILGMVCGWYDYQWKWVYGSVNKLSVPWIWLDENQYTSHTPPNIPSSWHVLSNHVKTEFILSYIVGSILGSILKCMKNIFKKPYMITSWVAHPTKSVSQVLFIQGWHVGTVWHSMAQNTVVDTTNSGTPLMYVWLVWPSPLFSTVRSLQCRSYSDSRKPAETSSGGTSMAPKSRSFASMARSLWCTWKSMMKLGIIFICFYIPYVWIHNDPYN